MTYIPTSDFRLDMARGIYNNIDLVHKFGHSDSISTSFVPITSNNVYQMPTAAVSLEIVSTAVADNQAGIGARTVTIEGADATGAEQVVTTSMHATDGTIAVAVTGTWLRVYRMYVGECGSYFDGTSVYGHVGTITAQVSGGGASWGVLELHSNVPLGQSNIGCYTIPLGKNGYVGNILVETDSSKVVDVIGFRRADILNVAAPYDPARAFIVFTGISDAQPAQPKTWTGPYPELTDIVFVARTSAGTQAVSVDFEIALYDN